jgi:hypothetical protein
MEYIVNLIFIKILFSFSFPPPYVKGHSSNKWLLDAFADFWSFWLPSDTMTTIRRYVVCNLRTKSGFFSGWINLHINPLSCGKVWLTTNTIFCMCNIWVIRRRNVIYFYNKKSYLDQLCHCRSLRIWCH